jgi:hypothetical protein
MCVENFKVVKIHHNNHHDCSREVVKSHQMQYISSWFLSEWLIPSRISPAVSSTVTEDTEGIATVRKNHHRHSDRTPMLHLSACLTCTQFLGLLPKPLYHSPLHTVIWHECMACDSLLQWYGNVKCPALSPSAMHNISAPPISQHSLGLRLWATWE